MGIIGNPFKDFVKKQVNTRQKALGEGLKDKDPIKLDTQKAFNQSSPWIRLASGVRITDNGATGNTYKQLSQLTYIDKKDWDGDALSKNLVLAGGATDDKGNFIAGINGDSILKKAYGYGGNQINGRGFVPMPGIISCDFEYKNDGALAFAKVQIKAFSKEQFQLLDILYQRPGYTCLLEFGHSVFLGNDGKVKYAGNGNYSFNTKPFQKIFSSPGAKNNFFNMAQDIEGEREKWSGNYEGFFGRITKFKWKFNPDGTYDIEVNLVGTGDVISSLQVNIPRTVAKPFTFTSGGAVTKPSEKDKEEAKEEGATVIADAMASQLNFELYALFVDEAYKKGQMSNITIKKLPFFKQPRDKSGKILSNQPGEPVVEDVSIIGGVYKANVAGITKDYDPNTWIKFSVLLAMLQKMCNIKDENGKNYLLNFDFDFQESQLDTNFMATYPGNFAANPNKILAEYVTPPLFTGYSLPLQTTINSAIKNGFGFNNKELGTDINPQFYRRLGDIFININFIADQLKSLKGTDSDAQDGNEIRLLDFLKSILEEINTQMGGINNFRVVFDDKTNKISFVSQTPLISKQEPKDPTVINTFGLTTGQGSFVKGVDLDSELTDAMANQITMAAQSNEADSKGSGVDGTSFSSYNGGLVDRLFVKKTSAMQEAVEKKEVMGVDTTENYYTKVWDSHTKEAFREIYEDNDFDGEYVEAMQNIVAGISKHMVADLTSQPIAKTQATFFLPFNLGITMHGLSGIKIFQSFQTTGRELPLSYNPALISLIVKSYSHNVSAEGWTTKISTFVKPLKKVDTSALKAAAPDAPSPPKPSPGANGPVSEGEAGKTTPSGYPVGKIYYTNPTNKIQIYLHHTAGWQNIKQVIAGWNTRTDHVSTHFVTNNNGEAERLFKDEEHGNHLGIKSGTFAKVGASYQNLNRVSLGIEMCSIGPLKLKGDKYYCYPSKFTTLYDPTKKTTSRNGDVQAIVGENFIPNAYKGYKYCEGFSDEHLAKVYNIVTAWKSKYGIPYVYNFRDIFPPSGKLSANALKGVKGIYTHNSVKTSKMDVMPTVKTLNLFKSLAD